MSWDNVERREFVRVKVPCRITITDPENLTIDCHTENISAGGIRVIIDKRLKISSRVKLVIYITEDKTITSKGKIVWAFARKDTLDNIPLLFDTGIEFDNISQKDIDLIKNLVVSIGAAESDLV
jgi:c-di-GMP-binding flagellar brake protein YcgR